MNKVLRPSFLVLSGSCDADNVLSDTKTAGIEAISEYVTANSAWVDYTETDLVFFNMNNNFPILGLLPEEFMVPAVTVETMERANKVMKNAVLNPESVISTIKA